MKHPFETILPEKKTECEPKAFSASINRREVAGLVIAFPAFAIVACGRLPLENNEKDDPKNKVTSCSTSAQAECNPKASLDGDLHFATSLANSEEGGKGLVLSQAAQEAGSISKLTVSTQTLAEEGADNFVFTFDLKEDGGAQNSTATQISTNPATTAVNESGIDPGPLTTGPEPGESGGAITTALHEGGGGPATTAPSPGESGGALNLQQAFERNFHLTPATTAHSGIESGGPLTTAPDPGESGGAVTDGENAGGGSATTTAAGLSESGGDSVTEVVEKVHPTTVDGVAAPNEEEIDAIRASAAVARENLGADYTSLNQAEEGGGFANLATSNASTEEGGAGNEVTSVNANEEGGDTYLSQEATQGWLAISNAFSSINDSLPPSRRMRFKLLVVRYKGKRQIRAQNEQVYLILYSLKIEETEFKLRHAFAWAEVDSAAKFTENIKTSLNRRFGIS